MDVIAEIEVIESDVKDVEQKCKQVNCSAIYDAIMASLAKNRPSCGILTTESDA